MSRSVFAFARSSLLAAAAAGFVLAGAAPATLAAENVTVFGAASLTDALKAAAAEWQTKGHGPVVLSFGSSATIAKQIEQGAPADIFASADERWMTYLADKGLVDANSVRRPIGNDLALIGGANQTHIITIAPGFDLLGALQGGRLAIGDPKSVPAGRYAQQSLTNLGVWDEVSQYLAPASDVRAAMALVQRGEAPLGIVYATDAMGHQETSGGEMKMLTLFPEDSHDPIVYPMAIVAGRERPEVTSFFAFLTGPEGKAVFGRYGFRLRE